MSTIEENKTNNDKEALIHLWADVYKVRHPIRFRMLAMLVGHMGRKIGEESAIYNLMEIMLRDRKG